MSEVGCHLLVAFCLGCLKQGRVSLFALVLLLNCNKSACTHAPYELINFDFGFINDENAGSLFTDDLTQTFIASTRIANSVSQNAIRY